MGLSNKKLLIGLNQDKQINYVSSISLRTLFEAIHRLFLRS